MGSAWDQLPAAHCLCLGDVPVRKKKGKKRGKGIVLRLFSLSCGQERILGRSLRSVQ